MYIIYIYINIIYIYILCIYKYNILYVYNIQYNINSHVQTHRTCCLITGHLPHRQEATTSSQSLR